MKHSSKIEWMENWVKSQNFYGQDVILDLEGECGFGRECVGVTCNGLYPDYEWYDYDTYERLDSNGDVWIPDDAYHKHDCVAVLGRGEAAEEQLYEWLKWFDDNNFKLESGKIDGYFDPIEKILGKDKFSRMVRRD